MVHNEIDIKLKEKFEKFMIKAFGQGVKTLLIDFDVQDGYKSEIVNAAWIAFNAGDKLNGVDL